MSLQLIKAWEDVEKLKNDVKNRKDFIITVNKKYFSLIKYENFINNVNILSTDEKPMKAYTGVNLERVYRLWVNYDIDFFNGSTTLLHNLKSEIILSSLVGDIAFDTKDFKVPINLSLDATSNNYVQSQTIFTEFPEEENHFRISRSLIIIDLDRTNGVHFHPHFTSNYVLYPYLNPNGLPIFNSKLVLELHNPTEYF